MSSHEAQRFQAEPWQPKERRTVMQNPPDGIPVERVELHEHFATEPSKVHLVIPKVQIDLPSMQKTRFDLPPNIWGPVRNHAVVALTTSADLTDRRRSLAQLRTMSASGDEQAKAVLEAMNGLVIE